MGMIRILLIADTHLGFDLPFRPRIQRRRRGPDFFVNFRRALSPALHAEVDAVVHGGDLLYRSKVPPQLVEMALEPLRQVADTGIPVYLVPGNHERSAIPHGHLATHPNIFLFDRPRTFLLETQKGSLALAGFPFIRSGIRRGFPDRLAQTGWQHVKADIGVLCIHQAVDGAAVGPGGFTFRDAFDVIRAADIPHGFSAVLAGHIHRFQVLTRDLKGAPLNAPVFYPGAIERTSFAERNETKGYLILEFETQGPAAAKLQHWNFHELPARPMIQMQMQVTGMNGRQIQAWIQSRLFDIPSDSVLQIKVHGSVSEEALRVLSAPCLRALAPATMNITATFVDWPNRSRQLIVNI
jgi:exonuclease SbcD